MTCRKDVCQSIELIVDPMGGKGGYSLEWKNYKFQQKMVRKQIAREEIPKAPGPSKLEMDVRLCLAN